MALLLAGLLVLPAGAAAQRPESTDVLFVVDTTGSMYTAIDEAKAQAQGLVDDLQVRLPNLQFGVAAVGDYPIYPYGWDGDEPYRLVQPITDDETAFVASVNSLVATGGGDLPEAYGRAMHEATSDPAVGWREGARHIVVFVADSVPHDDDINEGIPEEHHAAPSPLSTVVDPGRDVTPGTEDDLDWQSVLADANRSGTQLVWIYYHGDPLWFPYWQVWTERVGGVSDNAAAGQIMSKVVRATETAALAPLPACEDGSARLESGECSGDATPDPVVTPDPPPPPAPVVTPEPIVVPEPIVEPPQPPTTTRVPLCADQSEPRSGSCGRLLGTRGGDLMRGSRYRDRMLGMAGNDRIHGFGGNDTLAGGHGADRLFGAAGADLLLGGVAGDLLVGGPGSDRLFGGHGSDRLVGGPGRDVLSGGAGDDVINARDGVRERVFCGSGRDLAIVDSRDVVSGDCERVLVTRRGTARR